MSTMAVNKRLCLLLLRFVGLASFFAMVHGAKVLFVPVNVNSHVLDHGHLAKALVEEGHEATLLVATNARVPDWLIGHSNITILRYPVETKEPFLNSEEGSKGFVKIAMAESFFGRFSALMEVLPKMINEWHTDCEALFETDEITKHVMDTHYDVAVSDTTGLTCHALYPYARGLPFVHYGIVSYGWIYRVPDIPSFVPMSVGSNSDKMNFWERTTNLLSYLGTELMLNHSTHYLEKYAPDKPAISPALVYQQALLTLEITDVSTWYPKPRMPNTISMGDLIAQPSKPLSGDLKNFMDVADKGVILVSFGSYFDYLPPSVATIFCDVFSGLEQSVLWKTQRQLCQDSEESAGRIRVMSWIPQNDLLGHPNMKLFISHCGLNSVLEALYHKVPILGIPIAHDQPFNARMVQEKGYGLSMAFPEITKEKLRLAIKSILTEPSFQKNVQIGSEILKNKPDTPGKRASFWIDHVVKYGDGHLRTAAFDLNVFQFMLFDIYLFFTIISVVAVSVIAFCTKCTISMCWSCCCGRKSSVKSKTE